MGVEWRKAIHTPCESRAARGIYEVDFLLPDKR